MITLKPSALARGVILLERELDELVYAFHGLTSEEIKLVEGSAR